MRCLTSARFNMTATVLTQSDEGQYGGTVDPEDAGEWINKQDPETGEIIRIWVPKDADDDRTNVFEEKKIRVIARAVLEGGIRVAGTTERITPMGIVESVDFIKIQFPANETLTKRDRITNITNRDGIVIWREEESHNSPTIFDVLGVSPITDPWGKLIEWTALLQRSETQ